MSQYFRLELPPGAHRNGTALQSRGRWRDVNLVRWHEGALLPVGGWTRYKTGTYTGIARGGVTWTDNSGGRWIAWGTADYAYASDDDGAITDITPVGLTAGHVDGSVAGGYGDDLFGTGTYGTPRPDTGTVTLATSWSWDTFGEIPVSCSDRDGRLWEWDLNVANNLTQITNSPTSCKGLVVTAERFILALGDGGDPRSIRWCDREDRTVWTAAVTNQAGDWTLDTDGEIMFGLRAPGETLIVTSTDAHVARYTGYPDVYAFQRVGTGCGAPGRRVGVRAGDMVVWLGHLGFYAYAGGVVRRIPCAVWDFFIGDLSRVQASKVYGWHNHEWSEVWWCYPSDTTNECDSYIAWNYETDHWTYGKMPASTVLSRGTFLTPMGLHTDGKVYQQESGYDHGSETPYAESGPIEIGEGDRWVHVTKLIPDEETLASTTLTFKTKPYPTATATTHGPYTMAEPTSVRFSGREFVLRVAPSGESDWRFGVPRLEMREGGRR